MMQKVLSNTSKPLTGEVNIPGDKSISHRAIMFGSLACGKTKIENFLEGEDCFRTIEIFREFGVHIEQNGTTVIIDSNGVESFQEPLVPLYFGNSGTTARLMLGLLAAFPFHTVSYGDPHLTKRPMDRVTNPLKEMGAIIDGRDSGSFLPLAIRGTELQPIHYTLPVKSAQVKSAILLAGLFTNGLTTVIEKAKTRNHTENMLRAFGANVETNGSVITIEGGKTLTSVDVMVPGDISSAAFFLTAAAIVPDSKLILRNVGLNDTRTGIMDVLKAMGSQLTISNQREIGGESMGDIIIQYRDLKGITISGDMIPRLIDEIPCVALLATQANGKTVIRDAKELRVKETDRIQAVVELLTSLGANIEELEDGMIIHGRTELKGQSIKSYSDHRMAMMGAIASLIAKGNTTIDDISPVNISYPAFFNHLEEISK